MCHFITFVNHSISVAVIVTWRPPTAMHGMLCVCVFCVLCVITMIFLPSSLPSSPSSMCLGHDLRKKAVTSALCAQRSLVPSAGSEWVDPEDPTVIAETELLGAAASIEAAAKKLEQLKPRAKPKVGVSQSDEGNDKQC